MQRHIFSIKPSAYLSLKIVRYQQNRMLVFAEVQMIAAKNLAYVLGSFLGGWDKNKSMVLDLVTFKG